MHSENESHARPRTVSCMQLFWVFFRIGLMTFGGGFAMAVVVRHELVLKRKWLTKREFVDSLSTAAAVPGAVAVNVAFMEGRKLRGTPGAIAAAAGTMCPSIIIILLIARFAAPYFDHPQVAPFLKGAAIAVTGQIAYAAYTFANQLRRRWQNVAVCAVGLGLVLAGLHPVWAVVVAGGLGYAVMGSRMMRRPEEDETEEDIEAS